MRKIIDNLRHHQQTYNLSNFKMARKLGISRGTYDNNMNNPDRPLTISFIHGVLRAFPEYEKLLLSDIKEGLNAK